MRLGLSTPIVVQVPGVASPWEAGAGPADLIEIAMAADDLGYEFLTCSEHVAIPADVASARGDVYWDPLATLSYLAARTTRIQLVTAVLVLGYHHPLEIAKRFGTLDMLSAGRLVLGVGIGSLREEFNLLGAQWRDRAARADDALRALRASMSSERPEYHGAHFSYAGMSVCPHASASRVPIWVGGRSVASLDRAVRLADGWMPFGLRRSEVESMLERVETPRDFEVILPTGPLDPHAEEATVHRLERLRQVGATAISCTVTAGSIDEYIERLGTLKRLADTI
ncbi:TIGR03619 family F420-dependent LLM class oxidoreductase [Mycolicibacterium sp. F2034L]|uniref:TIGR03619 family F420-dependent LLM class oxidoreductase n=1 Tax=Mycolicibacterium sp. F2034L TaxID=2926422 RepID=UPI001FF6087D|nr:TIGR03619 family F420-dependent LLM class oxidoreductase [Mycolicibacterium sp. F2034L]MCK0175446.1 TIGR03619 family F420-dependent LLM class oxidoreductase [Mycolicibacterium sp. F2034L]